MKIDDVSFLVMYAVSPCHVGSGSALGTVDLPIQRERHTNWPFIPSSGMKGAFRSNFERYKSKRGDDKLNQFKQLTDNIFGDSSAGGSEYGGAISISDAKILAFPMRSNICPFVWITCPAVLKRLNRDLAISGNAIELNDENIKKIFDVVGKNKDEEKEQEKAVCFAGGIKGQVLLEDYEVSVEEKADITELKPLLKYFYKAEQLLIVNDEVFNYGVSDCTQISAQIKIKEDTGTTQDKSLRYQEDLPADTILYSVINWGDTRSGEDLKAETIRSFIKDKVIATHIQVGGDETLGHGIFELSWEAADAN